MVTHSNILAQRIPWTEEPGLRRAGRDRKASAHSGFVVVSHRGFNFHFPSNEWCLAVLRVAVSYSRLFFGETSIQSFCPVFTWIVVFLPCCRSSLRISGYKTFVRYIICKYFLPVSGWYPFFSIMSVEEGKVILMKSSLTSFSFLDHPWCHI